jgi:hypothetical protein
VQRTIEFNVSHLNLPRMKHGAPQIIWPQT